jgi:hypothetical protein
MSQVQDSNTSIYLNHHETPFKENIWVKNKQAHALMREKQNTGVYCTRCSHRHCKSWDGPELVHGNRSLKKSKIPIKGIVKYVENSALNPYFVYIRNGETTLKE